MSRRAGTRGCFRRAATARTSASAWSRLHAGGRNARAWLDQYTQSYFPTGIRVSYTVGGVIVHPTIKRTVTDGLITVGDAAHMINPLSGGGIVNAMKAGRLAAEVGVAALAAGDVRARDAAAVSRRVDVDCSATITFAFTSSRMRCRSSTTSFSTISRAR